MLHCSHSSSGLESLAIYNVMYVNLLNAKMIKGYPVNATKDLISGTIFYLY